MDIDKSLDEIIQAKPRTKRGGGGGRRGGPAAGGARARYATNVPKAVIAAKAPPVKPVTAEAFKIIISNLPMDVTEAAVRDLMQSTVGPVRTVQMAYNANGKSTGVATVVFKNKGDANKAHASYHNRMIDNQRPMKVEIAIDPNQAVSLASRVAPNPAARGAAPARGGAGARGGRGRGGAAGKPRNPRPAKKTAEELDAEMTAYKETGTA